MVVPTFVTTFAPPLPALASAGVELPPLLPVSTSSVLFPATFPELPTLGQPFVVGPGFSPIPGKLVAQITSGKFVEFADLLAANSQQTDPEPQLLLDGKLILTSAPRRSRRQIEDILSWTEAFLLYSLVVTTYFPHRRRDLLLYELLILRTYRQFGGKVWRSYDRAFREHAAAVKLTDWSSMNVQIYNFHAAGGARGYSRGSSGESGSEPSGTASAKDVCRSWNGGKCSSLFTNCRYAHKCANCHGSHRSVDCDQPDKSADKRSSESRSPAHENTKRKRY